MKYSRHPFAIDKATAKELTQKIRVFQDHYPTEKQIFLGMITSRSIKNTAWVEELIDGEVTLDDLFMPI